MYQSYLRSKCVWFVCCHPFCSPGRCLCLYALLIAHTACDDAIFLSGRYAFCLKNFPHGDYWKCNQSIKRWLFLVFVINLTLFMLFARCIAQAGLVYSCCFRARIVLGNFCRTIERGHSKISWWCAFFLKGVRGPRFKSHGSWLINRNKVHLGYFFGRSQRLLMKHWHQFQTSV